MAKKLVAVSGLKGILFSSFGVLRRLEDDGHEIVLASPSNVKDWTEVNGFPFLQLPNYNSYILFEYSQINEKYIIQVYSSIRL